MSECSVLPALLHKSDNFKFGVRPTSLSTCRPGDPRAFAHFPDLNAQAAGYLLGGPTAFLDRRPLKQRAQKLNFEHCPSVRLKS